MKVSGSLSILMKIVQVVHSLPFLNQAGTEIYTDNLCRELSKRHKVFLFCRNSDIRQKDFTLSRRVFNHSTVYLINNTFRDCDSFETYYDNPEIDDIFAGLLDEIKPDIVHIQHLVFLSLGIIGKIKQRNIPIVFTLHDYWVICPKWHLLKKNLTPCDKAVNTGFDDECSTCLWEILNIKRSASMAYSLVRRLFPAFVAARLKKIYFLCGKISAGERDGVNRLYQRKRRINDLLKDVDMFLAPSEYLKNRFIRFGISADKIRRSRYGLDTGLFKGIQKAGSSNNIRFGFMGTLLPAKGLHVLIEAFNRIENNCAELKIYGKRQYYKGFEYYLPYVTRIIKNKNIKFMGEFAQQEIGDVLGEVDILIVPSIWPENSPLVIQEALLAKIPVIASRIGGIPELIKDGLNGLLFNPGDSRELQEKIEYIINDPGLISIFKEHIGEVRTIEDNAKEIEDIYSQLLVKMGG